MAESSEPTITEMSLADSEALLARNHLGRMAFSFHDQVELQPLFYVFDDGWIYGRTSQGAKLDTLKHNRWVAFQVDEILDFRNWKSVIVRGAVHLLEDPSAPRDRELRDRALHALRSIVPETLEAADPFPHRTVLFALSPQEVSGRQSADADPV